MQLFSSYPSAATAVACTVHHPFGVLAGYSEVQDHTGRIKVVVFPFALLASLIPTGEAVAGCYILASRTVAYIGESNHVTRRLSQHRDDPLKRFADTVYVICGVEHRWLDKASAIYLQERLTCRIEEIDAVTVHMGARPQCLDVQPHKRAWLERYASDAEQLLRIVGCSAFQRQAGGSHAIEGDSENDDCALLEEDDRLMEIGFVPIVGQQFELDYVGLWARGLYADDGFVVLAGSEIRASVNPSASPIVNRRRAELAHKDVLAPVPGVEDRTRLRTAVWFPSAAIAAKVVTGAHISSSVWVASASSGSIHIAD